MKTRRPKLGLKDKPVAGQINLARRLAGSLDGDAAMAAHAASLGRLQVQIIEIDAAVAAISEARANDGRRCREVIITSRHPGSRAESPFSGQWRGGKA